MKTQRDTARAPRAITLNGRSYHWDEEAGLESSACLEVEGFIRRRAWLWASRARLAGLDIEDLVQEGMAAALQAARRFNPDAGAKYLTYAAPWINAAMEDALSERCSGFTQHGSRVRLESFDAPASRTPNGSMASLLDFQVDDGPSAEALLEALERDRALQGALGLLSPRQRRVLVWRHGLDGSTPKSASTVAKALGMAKAQAEEVYHSALSQLSRTLNRDSHQPTLAVRRGRGAA